jgi:hypothetical protein
VNDTTARALNALNQSFYSESAEEFAATRSASWPGWRKLLPLLREKRNAAILDVGCGNARFASFLSATLGAPSVLDRRERTSAHPPSGRCGFRARALLADLVLRPPSALPDERFVRGVRASHHIPQERAGVPLPRWRAVPPAAARAHVLDFRRAVTGKVVRIGPALAPLTRRRATPLGLRRSDRLRYCHYTDVAEEAACRDLPRPRLSFASDGQGG